MCIIDRFKSYAALLAAAALAIGCSGEKEQGADPDEPGVPAAVSVTIAARQAPASRADGVPEDPADDNERINSWFIAFVDRSGRVARVISRTDPETEIVASTGPVERETFKCVVPTGTYNLYAFANITPAQLTDAAGVTLAEGGTIDRDALENAAWSQSLNLQSGLVPMSGVLRGVKVANTIEETFAIEVVRMLAKARFVITNASGSRVTVSSISIDPVTTSPVSLFPRGADGVDYAHLGRSAYAPRAGAIYGTVACPVSITLADNASVTHSFRIQEAISDRPNGGAFTIGLTVAHADGITDLVQHNITRDILGYINRNDIIEIPITLSPYHLELEALFYPPIGGYPAMMSAVDPDGAQIFTFGTQGEFAIVARILDKKTEAYLSPMRYRAYVSSVSDPDGIFLKQPALDPSASAAMPPELLGELSTSQGRATVTVRVDIYASAADADPVRTIYRTLYIIRDNNTL